jgi:hypothetical protein
VIEFESRYNTYVVDCKNCDGAGDKTMPHDAGPVCGLCSGSGRSYKLTDDVEVGGVYLHPNYAALIIDEPGIEVHCDPENTRLFFRQVIDGVETSRGCIMGLSDKYTVTQELS